MSVSREGEQKYVSRGIISNIALKHETLKQETRDEMQAMLILFFSYIIQHSSAGEAFADCEHAKLLFEKQVL